MSLTHAEVLKTVASYCCEKRALRGRKTRERNLINKIDVAKAVVDDIALEGLEFNLREVRKEIAGIESNMEDLKRAALNSW